MSNECAAYYGQVMSALEAAGIDLPSEVFWAGVFACICEQVMMRVKPAGMVGPEMPRSLQITEIVAAAYGLHRVCLQRPTGGCEIWVCRLDDEETRIDLRKMQDGSLDWGQYHSLRGRLCGYPDEIIMDYTEGTWP